MYETAQIKNSIIINHKPTTNMNIYKVKCGRFINI